MAKLVATLLLIGAGLLALFGRLLPHDVRQWMPPPLYILVGVAVWFFFRARRKDKRYRSELESAIRDISGVHDSRCIDVCMTTAIALDYSSQTVYVIQHDASIRKLHVDKHLLGWQYAEPASATDEYYGNVVAGASIGLNSPSGAFRAASVGAVGTAAALAAVGSTLNKLPHAGILTLSVNDARQAFCRLYISDRNFIERLQHFWQVCRKVN